MDICAKYEEIPSMRSGNITFIRAGQMAGHTDPDLCPPKSVHPWVQMEIVATLKQFSLNIPVMRAWD